VTGGRVERWRHNLYDAWSVEKPELALLAELLLRGPQTAAEARSRASRMEPLDQETAATVVKGLVDRGLVVWLTAENRRGAVLTHGFHGADEIQRLKIAHSTGVSVGEIISPLPSPTPPDRIGKIEDQIAETRTAIAALQTEVEKLRAQLISLQEALGIQPSAQ
jgi:hypothetical protein